MRPALFALIVLLSACASPRPTVRVETVEVAVPVPAECPAPPAVVRPRIAVDALTPASPPADVARAYVATVVALRAYAAELEALLAAYRPAPDTLSMPRP